MQIKMTPQELFDAANKIVTAAKDYEADYNSLITTVDDLCGSAYVGEDANLFKEKVDNFKPKYIAMQKLMENYAEYLKNVAQAMLDNIDENISQINSVE